MGVIKKLIRCDSGDYIIIDDEQPISHYYYTLVDTNDETKKFQVTKLTCEGNYDDTVRVKNKLFKDGFREVVASTRFDDFWWGDGKIQPIDKINMDELTKGLSGNIFECDYDFVTHKVVEHIVKLKNY